MYGISFHFGTPVCTECSSPDLIPRKLCKCIEFFEMNKYSSVSVDTHIVDDVLACFRVPLDLRREKREHLAQNDV